MQQIMIQLLSEDAVLLNFFTRRYIDVYTPYKYIITLTDHALIVSLKVANHQCQILLNKLYWLINEKKKILSINNNK